MYKLYDEACLQSLPTYSPRLKHVNNPTYSPRLKHANNPTYSPRLKHANELLLLYGTIAVQVTHDRQLVHLRYCRQIRPSVVAGMVSGRCWKARSGRQVLGGGCQ